jgi:hypothetical protein
MPRTRKILVLIYALFYAWLAYGMAQGNVSAGYPVIYNVMSVLAQILVTAGIVLSTFDDPRPYNTIWKRLFPLLVLELAIEIVSDAVFPTGYNLETHGGVWLLNVLLTLVLVAPAYYFNYRVARS